jgi:2-amino-4-hydroxy-6-hydroxymethyldihydropteridine diphosphokinase
VAPVLLGLGSNVGDRLASLQAAVAALAPAAVPTAVSAVYETRPMYVEDQAAFLNIAVAAETRLGAPDLLARLKDLERRLGRTPGVRFGPRRIDIDILIFGEEVVVGPGLEVPHPRMLERGFVLVPAADVAARWRHPVSGRTIAEHLADLGPTGDVVPRPDLAIALAGAPA